MTPDGFPDFLDQAGEPGIPPYITGLARLELARHRAGVAPALTPQETVSLNPTLQITPVSWRHLADLLDGPADSPAVVPVPGNELIVTWRDPAAGMVMSRAASQADLLAIKLVIEAMEPAAAAREAGVAVGGIDAVLREAVRDGLLVRPQSRLRRDPGIAASAPSEEYAAAEVFTLQWHLTQECDLHCRHCYDRSARGAFPFERALTLLDELREFCLSRFIRGQVSLSGGNPLLYPRFLDLYRAAAERDLMIAILGNASDRTMLEQIIAIRMPVYFQVSLEGQEPHNDEIRGAGNFRRTVEFLRLLTELGVPNMVMLTLTRRNMDQVIPLAEVLEGVTGGLAFNRLALFGEGAALELPTPEEYRRFLDRYATACEKHPVLRLKDSLLNIVFEREGSGLFGGCAGYGCGAAFNFVSVLSDGEVHACRKFPSPIGSILTASLESIYDSPVAERYRRGSSGCSGCSLNAVCRGCPAVTASFGLDPFTEKDPFCFHAGMVVPS